MDMKKLSDRGFYGGEFKDSYGYICSLHESSSIDPHIWFGVSKNPKGESVGTYDPPSGRKIPNYMHLSQEQVAELLPLLQHFVKYGELPHSE